MARLKNRSLGGIFCIFHRLGEDGSPNLCNIFLFSSYLFEGFFVFVCFFAHTCADTHQLETLQIFLASPFFLICSAII